MSMPGSDMRPDDGPYTECEKCGAMMPLVPIDGDMLCDDCWQEEYKPDDDDDE